MHYPVFGGYWSLFGLGRALFQLFGSITLVEKRVVRSKSFWEARIALAAVSSLYKGLLIDSRP